MTKLYLAYGSNMNKAQMRKRCPAAKPLRAITIDDARLVFRGVADIEFCAGASVPVALWEITAECEAALDRYEGVNSGIYEKKYIPLDNGEEALTYVMCNNGIAPPTRHYFERIKQGYADFGVDPEALDVALKHSHVKQRHSAETRRRHVRNIANGNVQVARRPLHVPLSAIDPNHSTPECDVPDERDGICKHGWPLGVCEDCTNAAPTQPMLPLPKPDPRYDGYNWSERAKAGSAKGKGKSRVVYSSRDEDHTTNGMRVVRGVPKKRTNTKTIKVRKNLSDWLKDKGYSGENH